ncbi:MAG: hypothetical protein GX918_02560 [Clostridiales bacterium]|jgi:flagellar protein FlbB|nr:hypothetical protein [Clostridiales bacterium]
MAKKEMEGPKKTRRTRLVTAVAIAIIILLLGLCIAFNFAGLGAKVNNTLASLPGVGRFFKPVEETKSPEQLQREELEKAKKLMEQERANLDELASNLASWELQLKAKEEELEKQKEAVEELQQRLEARARNVEELVTYYQNMDATDAVKILDNIPDNQLVITILRNMKERKCSEILSAMDPKKAARLMEIMAAQ